MIIPKYIKRIGSPSVFNYFPIYNSIYINSRDCYHFVCWCNSQELAYMRTRHNKFRNHSISFLELSYDFHHVVRIC